MPLLAMIIIISVMHTHFVVRKENKRREHAAEDLGQRLIVQEESSTKEYRPHCTDMAIFGLYHGSWTFLNFGMITLLACLLRTSRSFGMPFELYVIDFTGVAIVTNLLLRNYISHKQHGPIPNLAVGVALAYSPLTSRRFEQFRVMGTFGVYLIVALEESSWNPTCVISASCAVASVVFVFVPWYRLYTVYANLLDLRRAFLPLSDPGSREVLQATCFQEADWLQALPFAENLLLKRVLRFVRWMNAMEMFADMGERSTREYQRHLAMMEDAPHAVIGFFFTIAVGWSPMVVVTVCLALMKVYFQRVARKYFLCLCAALGHTWTEASPHDIQEAILFEVGCQWKFRRQVAVNMLQASCADERALAILSALEKSTELEEPDVELFRAVTRQLRRQSDVRKKTQELLGDLWVRWAGKPGGPPLTKCDIVSLGELAVELDHFDSPEDSLKERALENLLTIKCPWRALIADGGCVTSGLYNTKRNLQVKWLQLVGDVFSENAALSICQDLAVLLGGVEKDAGPEVRVSWLHAMAMQGSAASANDATRVAALLQDDRHYTEAVAVEDVAAKAVAALSAMGDAGRDVLFSAKMDTASDLAQSKWLEWLSEQGTVCPDGVLQHVETMLKGDDFVLMDEAFDTLVALGDTGRHTLFSANMEKANISVKRRWLEWLTQQGAACPVGVIERVMVLVEGDDIDLCDKAFVAMAAMGFDRHDDGERFSQNQMVEMADRAACLLSRRYRRARGGSLKE